MIKTYNENKNGNEKENKAIITRNHKKIDELVILNNGLHSSSINVKTGEKKGFISTYPTPKMQLAQKCISNKRHIKSNCFNERLTSTCSRKS